MISPDAASTAPADSVLAAPCLATLGSGGSSASSGVDTTAEPSSPAAASDAAASDASDSPTRRALPAFDTASEVQEMAAQVLQRKQQRSQHTGASRAAALPPQDPLHLLTQPQKNLRARKEQLMSAVGSNSNGGSARVAAAKEELAGVQARLRDALGLREEGSEEACIDYYQPPLLKRISHTDPYSPTPSYDGTTNSSSNNNNKVNRVRATSAAVAERAAAANAGAKAAALSYRKQPAGGGAGAAAAASAPSGAAARARAAGGPARAPPAATATAPAAAAAGSVMYFDTSSEVAEMAARVLRRRNESVG